MTTLQIRHRNFSVQSGASDLVAAYTIATGVGGWVGGLETFKAWRQVCSRVFGATSFGSDIEKLRIKESSQEVAILTNGGLKIFDDEETPAFGGDPMGQ